jgi:capsular exopolysaccharide synthesis family protein
VTAGQDSDLAVTRATASSAALAARLADAYAAEYVALRRRTDRARVIAARERVVAQLRQLPARRRRGREARRLRDRLEELGVLLALRDGNVQLVERAVAPQTPFAPRPRRTGLVGLLAGLLAGLAIAAVRDRAGRRVRRSDDLDRNLHLPVLARVPQSRALDRLPDISGPRGEPFRTLRATLRTLQGERPHRSIAVCSSEPGEGKTLVSWGLALAEAHAGGRVLLVETDLRLPALSARLAIGQPAGLTQLLQGETPREDAIVTVASSGHRLDVLPAGTPSGDAAELLESDAMARLLADLEAEYEVVVLDTAPFMVVTDAMPLLSQVGGVVIVTRVGVTSIELVTELRRRLTRGRARIFGVVLNGTPDDLPDARPPAGAGSGRRALSRA